jgi:hypothetical protein
MTTIPQGLADLLEFGDLPVVALKAAVDHRELRLPVARRPKLPASVIERCFVPGAPPSTTVAVQLVGRRMTERTLRWVLHDAAERRPAVLRALLAHNVPDARERRWVLTHPDPDVRSAVLANRAWPLEDQLAVARQTDGSTVLGWLASMDPEVPVTAEDLFGDHVAGGSGGAEPGCTAGRSTTWRLDGHPTTALQAMMRRPWVAELPPALLSHDARSAAATIAHDERRLYALLGYAQQLAAAGRSGDAASIVEAVACNPTAPLPVQRRARRLHRRLSCHYLQGWRPTAVTEGPLWEADHDAQRRAMDRLEELAEVRHRTVWSAGVLALNPNLAGDVRERLIAYFGEHLAAVDFRDFSVDVLADRLQVTAAVRRRWHRAWADSVPPSCLAYYGPDPDTERRWGRGLGWEELHLDDLQAAVARRFAVRRLRAALGRDHEAWSLAFLLLREGWELPLAEIPGVVAALRLDASEQEDAA